MRVARQESGFTIIEVIIAAIVMASVIAAAAVAFTSSFNTQARSKVAGNGREAAATVLRKLQSDASWVAECERTAPATPPATPHRCTIPLASVVSGRDLRLIQRDGTVRHALTLTATAVDLEVDNLWPNDTDRRWIDVWRLRVTNDLTGPVMPPGGARFVADGVVNPSVRGATGVVRIRMCAVDRQVDERVGLGLCSNGATGSAATRSIDITPPPATTCTGSTLTLVCTPWNSAEAADDSLGERYTSVRVRPMGGASVTLEGPLNGSSSSRTVTMATSGTGLGAADVRGLAPGQYRVTTASPLSWGGSTWKAWSSHSVPSGGHLIVEKGGLREATIIMRPPMPSVRLNVETLDRSNPFNPHVLPVARFDQTVRLMPIPVGRTNLERGTSQNGWTTIRQGNNWVTLAESSPGLYSIYALHYPRSDVSRLRGGQQYVWIDPDGSTSPSSLTIRQDYCNKVVRNNYVRHHCGDMRWCWVGPTFVGQCNDNPSPTGPANAGTGGA